MQVFQDITEHIQIEQDLFHRVITGDETWIFECDQVPEQSVKVSNIDEVEESKIVKVMCRVVFTMSSCHSARQSIS